MADQEQPAQSASSSSPEQPTREEKLTAFQLQSLRFAAPDWYLQTLVDLVNDPANGEVRIPLTLHLSGLIVSGRLVSGAHYFDHMFEEIKSLYVDDLLEETRQIYAKFAATYRAEPPPQDDTGPQFIHLCDAQVWDAAGHHVPSGQGVWWRGRLTAVSGFVLGNLQRRVQSAPQD